MIRYLARGMTAIVGCMVVGLCGAQDGAILNSPAAEAMRTFTFQQQGLNNAALNLSSQQKARIHEIVSAYVGDQLALSEKHWAAKGESVQAANAARAAAQVELSQTLGQVLTPEQRQTWEAARRRSPGGDSPPTPRRD